MRSTLHKLLTCSLLATYVGISLLGQGLHLLTPEDEHHHYGSHVAAAAVHTHSDECCDDHDSESAALITVAAGSAADSHSCEICEFLFQAVGEAPQVAVVPDLHPLVAPTFTPHVEIYSQAILGLHAARGPPQLLG